MTAPAISQLQMLLRHGQVSLFLTAPTWVDSVVLPAGTAASYTMPAAAALIRVSALGYPVYMNLNGAAAVPAAGHTDGSASFPIAGPRELVVPASAVLSFISAVATIVTIEVFK